MDNNNTHVLQGKRDCQLSVTPTQLQRNLVNVVREDFAEGVKIMTSDNKLGVLISKFPFPTKAPITF